MELLKSKVTRMRYIAVPQDTNVAVPLMYFFVSFLRFKE